MYTFHRVVSSNKILYHLFYIHLKFEVFVALPNAKADLNIFKRDMTIHDYFSRDSVWKGDR